MTKGRHYVALFFSYPQLLYLTQDVVVRQFVAPRSLVVLQEYNTTYSGATKCRRRARAFIAARKLCLLYTSDAADE